MSETLNGRHFVVTGGSGALGYAVVQRLVDAGATCYVPCRETAVPDYLAALGAQAVIATDIDLTDQAQVDAYYGDLPGLWASIQIAGGFAMAGIAKSGADLVHQQFAMNALSCMLSCRAAVVRMRADDTYHGGRLVNIAARPALEPRSGANMTAYTASKAAVAGFTQALAAELSDDGINVNAVAPSILDTPANRAAMPKADHGSWLSLDDAADLIMFLASPANAAGSGAVIPMYARA